jgi:hypothetical protein
MLRSIAKTIASLIVPILLEELKAVLEVWLQQDLDNDGVIGRPDNGYKNR